MTDERVRRSLLLKGETDVFALNEGVCPDCFGDAKMVNRGGITKFFEQYTFQDDDDVVKTYWAEDASMDFQIIGGIQFLCEDGHQHYIEVDKFGDWHGRFG